MYEGATEITEINVTSFSTTVAAASFKFEDATYYAYMSKAVNEYNKSVLTAYVVLDAEGNVAKFDYVDIFGDEEYFHVAGEFVSSSYKEGFVGATSDLIDTELKKDGNLAISGATLTSNAFANAFKDAFAMYNASKGGNE